MIRWVASLPAEALFPLFIGVGILVTVALDAAVRRYVRPETRERANSTAGTTLQVTATIFAILIAFVIVDEYSQVQDAQGQITQKAAALSVVYENSRALPSEDGEEIRGALLDYARSVVRFALPQLEDSATPNAKADRALQRVYDTVQGVEPQGEAQRTAYDATVGALDDVTRTKARIVDSARPTVPTALFWMLFVVGIVVMSVATLLDTRHRRSHLFILSALAVVVWLTLALVASLDYPFDGIIKVSDAPIREFIQLGAAR
jgi:hypothetical protein